MVDGFILALIAGVIIVAIVNYYVFIRNRKPGDQTRTIIDIHTIKESKVSLAMIGSYIIFGGIIGLALTFTSFSDWLIMVIILGTMGICIYGSLMRKKWALIPWGAMSLAALVGIFLEIDYAKMSLWGIIGLILIAVILHYYNVEKTVWN